MNQEQNQGRPRVLVAVLHTGHVRWELAAWLCHLVANERRGAVMVKFYGGDQFSHPVNSNRNRILQDAPIDIDAVLMIDEDTVPDPDTIMVGYMCCPEEKGGLGLDVVLAPVPIMRTDDERGPIMANLVPLGAEGGSHDDVTIPVGANRIMEIKEGGTGVIGIARHVIDHSEMRAPFRFEYDDDGRTIVGEDHFFCRMARAAGFKVYAALGYVQGHVKGVDLKTMLEMYQPGPAQRPALVITGTGRCGTGYAAQWLTSAGLRCGHEAIFMYRGIEAALKRSAMFKQFHADASWMAAPYLDHELLDRVPVIYQMRHPKKVIESWMRKSTEEHTPRYWRFVLEHAPEIGEQEQEIDQFSARYVLWTEMIENALRLNGRAVSTSDPGHSFYIWRVEDGEDGVLAWLADRNLIDLQAIDRAALFPDRSYNHKSGDPVEARLVDISEPWRSRLIEICKRYQYGTDW